MSKKKSAGENRLKTREERLAAQLRANLARRKSQVRERRSEENIKPAEKKPR